MSDVYFSLGTNLGNKRENIQLAVNLLADKVGRVLRQSSLYVTDAWGFESENQFINACVECETELSPNEVLATTQNIERQMGRKHKSVNRQYHDRIIDIDILFYDHLQINEPDLIIPHPLIWQRDFVLEPLSEICLDLEERKPIAK